MRMPDTASPPSLPQLSYAQVRRRWFWSTLVQLLRKWAIYIVMGLGIFGAFSVGATTSMAALTAWTVAPLFKATQWPWHVALGTALAHGLIGALVLLALRPVMWSRAWLEAERALPIAPSDMKASDASLTLLCLLPLFSVYVAGAATWSVQAPAWLRGTMLQGWAWLCVSMVASAAGGWASIAHFRRPATSAAPVSTPGGGTTDLDQPRGLRRGPGHGHTAASSLPHTGLVRSLLVLPLWRGPARGLALALIGFIAGTLIALVFIHLSSAHLASWGLAGMALWTLMATARLHQLHSAQLQPLHEAACAALPVHAHRLRAFRLVLVGLPAGLALVALPAIWLGGTLAVRPAVAALYWLGFAAFHAWHATHAPHDAQSQVSRWLGALIVLTALASEVYPG